MPDATTWLRRVNQNPEKYGIKPEHIRKVDRDIKHLTEMSDAERLKREKRMDSDE